METGFILLAAVATAINFIFLKYKLEKKRYSDFITDIATMLVLGMLFAGTMGGLAIAMLAGFIISVYLWFRPPDTQWYKNMFGEDHKDVKVEPPLDCWFSKMPNKEYGQLREMTTEEIDRKLQKEKL